MPGLILDADTWLRLRHSLSTKHIHGLNFQFVPPDVIDNIGEFTELQELFFGFGTLYQLPHWIRFLTGLRKLVFLNISLSRVPEWIAELKQLTELVLWGNRFTAFPAQLLHLPSLEYLDLYTTNGAIDEIPPDIIQLEHLENLGVRGHPIQRPPLEVVNQGVEAIKNYWRQRQDEGVDYLCEAKLLILGEPGAGKTSLANKIRDAAYVLKPEEVSTEGIEVAPWMRRARRCPPPRWAWRARR